MKFQVVTTFEQHVQSMTEKTLPALCLLLASDLLERQYLSSLMIGAVKKIYPAAEEVSLDLGELSADKIRDELTTSDLFAAKKIVHFKRIDEASKATFESLYTSLTSDVALPFLLFEGEHTKNDPKFLEKIQLSYVLMDLTKEKPWEKKNRIVHWAQNFANKNKKSFQKGILEKLYEQCHKNLSQMIQEVEKLICYAQEVTMITEVHVKMLCGLEEEKSSWSLAEAIVWDEEGIAEGAAHPIDVHQFYSMLGQLRYHYQIKNKLKQLIVTGASESDMVQHFPTLQPKTLSKYYKKALDVHGKDTVKALNALFECEMKAKSQSMELRLLWVHLLAQLK